jgi:predicted RNase H-like HicB family nuclease
MTVEELPDFFVAASTYDEVIAELRPALRAFLQSYAERGEPVPLPANPTLWRVQALVIAASAERRFEAPPGAHVTQAPITAAA